MNAMVISGIVFGCAFCGALLGMSLHHALPSDHLSDASKGVLNLAIGIIGTMAALVVGLLVGSAKATDQPFDGLVKISSAPLQYTLAHLGQ